MGTVRADGPSFDKLVEISRRIREKTGSTQRQHEFLRNHGVGTALETDTLRLGQSGGVGTQELSEDQISLYFSLYSDCNSDGYADGTYKLEFAWDYSAFTSSGEKSHDFVGIAWKNGTWEYETANTDDLTTSDSYISYEGGSSTSGPAFNIDDWNPFIQEYNYVSVDVNWVGDQDEQDIDTVSASYTHTYNEVNIDSVGVSFPAGVSVTVSDDSKSWSKDTEDNGDFTQLALSDATGCGGL